MPRSTPTPSGDPCDAKRVRNLVENFLRGIETTAKTASMRQAAKSFRKQIAKV